MYEPLCSHLLQCLTRHAVQEVQLKKSMLLESFIIQLPYVLQLLAHKKHVVCKRAAESVFEIHCTAFLIHKYDTAL